MAELPKEHEKDYLDLLYDYQSDETKKTRRNLSVVSFVIVALHLVGMKLTEARLLGTDLTHTNTRWLLGITAALILYWLIMGTFYALHDYQLHKERQRQLLKHVEEIKIELDRLANKVKMQKEAGNKNPPLEAQHNMTAQQYSVYTNQMGCTRWARRFGVVVKVAEYAVPVGFSAWALFYMVCDILVTPG